MGTIAAELENFKNALEGKTDSMTNVCNELETKLREFSQSSATYKNSFSSYYQSENKEIILSSFDCMAKIYSKIEESISSTLRPMITSSKAVLDNVVQLEKINEIIEEQQGILNNNKGDDPTSISTRNNANAVINSKNIQFNTLHSETLSLLNKLKAMDTEIVVEELTNADVSSGDIVVEGGTLTQQSFVASNGVTVNYYIYLPKVKDSSAKLPILTYFHGMQDTIDRNRNNNFKYGGGLAGLIENKLLTPKGIVLFPQAIGGTDDRDFWSRPYEEAVIELIKETAQKYNGDMNRVSVAGHSNGGAAAQHIVNNYPGFFAATALMGISSNAKEGLAQTHLYALVGARDHTMDSYGRAIGYAQKHNQMYKVYNMGHDIQTIAFQEPVEDENGKPIMLVDWLMSKTLND